MRIVYITSSLPNGNGEAFFIPEINQFLRQGHDLTIVPLYPRGPLVHEDIVPLLDRTIVRKLFAAEVLSNALKEFVARPERALKALASLRYSRNLRILMRNVAAVPKALWLARICRTMRCQHIHAHWGACTATMGMIASEVSGVPWSFTVHSWEIIENNLLGRKAQSAVFVRAISQYGRARLRSLIEPVPLLLHLGIDIPDQVIAPPLESGSRHCLCVIGSLLPVKGHRYMIEAWDLLRERGVDLDIEFVGDGPLREELGQEVCRRRGEERIRFMGHVSHSRVLDMLLSGRWSLMVLPSIVADNKQQEGIPVSLLEAMARGLPVIATATGGIAELLAGGAGLLVPPKDSQALADAIESLLLSSTLRGTLTLKGRARAVEDFSVARIVHQLANEFARPGVRERSANDKAASEHDERTASLHDSRLFF